MPIRFRCTYCNRLLGIATRKAGTETFCPHCGFTITVPVPTEDEAKTERVNVDDVDELFGNGATERIVEPATQLVQPPVVAAPTPIEPAHEEQPRQALPTPQKNTPPPAPKARTAPPPVPKNTPTPSDDPPLFEGDMDEILGRTAVPLEPDRPKPPPTSGGDAMSLGDAPRMLVISAQKATFLVAGVVVLLALAFAAGYFLAR